MLVSQVESAGKPSFGRRRRSTIADGSAEVLDQVVAGRKLPARVPVDHVREFISGGARPVGSLAAVRTPLQPAGQGGGQHVDRGLQRNAAMSVLIAPLAP